MANLDKGVILFGLKTPLALSFLVYGSGIRNLFTFTNLFPTIFNTVTTWHPQTRLPALSLPILPPVVKWSFSCEVKAILQEKSFLAFNIFADECGEGVIKEMNGLPNSKGYHWWPLSSSRMTPLRQEM